MTADTPHRKRCKRFNDPGHAHFLTFSCYRRRPFLSKDRTRLWTLDAIERVCHTESIHLWAWVLMPEHVHLLLWPSAPEYDISKALQKIKLSVNKRAIHYVRENSPASLTQFEDSRPDGSTKYRFWQRGGGYDRNLTEPSTIWSTIEYIHQNPVRRELCDHPKDWEWSSFRETMAPGSGRQTLQLESLSRTKQG